MISISERCAAALPCGKLLENCLEKDMDGVEHEAVRVAFTCDHLARVAFFDAQTGEYIGDDVI
jgi:hypothetical protein